MDFSKLKSTWRAAVPVVARVRLGVMFTPMLEELGVTGTAATAGGLFVASSTVSLGFDKVSVICE
jgi:hypothetical protein